MTLWLMYTLLIMPTTGNLSTPPTSFPSPQIAKRPTSVPSRTRPASPLAVVSPSTKPAVQTPIPGPTTRRAATLELGPMLFHVQGGKVKRIEQLDLQELFVVAAQAFHKKDYSTAIGLYRRIIQYFPNHPYHYAAFYNLGLSYEYSKQWTLAVETYQSFVKHFPNKKADVRHALFRTAACYEELLRWEDAFSVYDALLLQDLNHEDRVDALAAGGRAKFRLKQYAQARPLLRLAVMLENQHRASSPPKNQKFREAPAMAQYYLARIHDLQFRARTFSTNPEQMKQDLEYKSQQLLQAQQLYFDTIPLRHADWSLAALYRIGEMYEQMYQDIMKAPIPQDLKPDEVPVYIQALRMKIKVLLDKSLLTYQHNLRLAQRIGIADSQWYVLTHQRFQALLDFTVRHFGGPATTRPTSQPTSVPARKPGKP